MLRSLIGYITNKKERKVVVSRDSHCISRKDICQNALKVLYRLKKKGYDAYLVGGSVRDLLLQKEPKDFDIVTNATPEQVRRIFNNSRIIGRRFRLVHIYFDNILVEVATFRAGSKKGKEDKHTTLRSNEGLILRDNVFGSLEEDCLRRDFTVNALYYDITDFSIIDFTNGLKDLKNKTLRIIGNPKERYIEDPVRILRVIRFAAKLDFNIEKKTASPIIALSELLKHVSSSRLYDDVNKLFLYGAAEKTFALLRKYSILDKLFIFDESFLNDNPNAEKFIIKALNNTDIRVDRNRPVIPAFLYACLLWYPVVILKKQYVKDGCKASVASKIAMDEVTEKQRKITSIPWRTTENMRQVWDLQSTLENPDMDNIQNVLQDHKFKAAYDFLILRAVVETHLKKKVDWWTSLVDAEETARKDLIKDLKQPQKELSPGVKRRRNRRKKKSISFNDEDSIDTKSDNKDAVTKESNIKSTDAKEKD